MRKLEPGLKAGRLDAADYVKNFSDLHPRLGDHEALVASDRCYFCYDAPCMTACPTSIDIPLFIRQISTGNPTGSAKTIFDQNILGGMCARVCPTEQLCEEACVRNTAEERPVEIGRLQRYATDLAIEHGHQFYTTAASTGKSVAVVGAGPAGLACAHRLAMHGHSVTIYDTRPKAGGLNEYGIAAYKTPEGFAQAEVDYILSIGNIDVLHGQMLGRDFTLADLKAKFDAVFLGTGLGNVNMLTIPGADTNGVMDAVEFIAHLRQADAKSDVPVGRDVVVIGGGMTAIDAGVQAKLLGAENVTICYRRGKEHMNASDYEQDLAASKGVQIRHWLQPKEVAHHGGHVASISFEYTHLENGLMKGTGHITEIKADQILVAIGQKLDPEGQDSLAMQGGKIAVDAEGRTSLAGVWAGGDCAFGGQDLTVSAVAMGRDAAESINLTLAADASGVSAVA
ncbi:NAD(P)-dependent oxidoreductase [Agrobacterium vitis]|uniref:NAD(P)-dependent oxidoreductase n=1 Tax=Agrobacterium vitis TaxID=373 RepID=UPI0012E89D39|nr:NAD(P)-dependent oxidoreductase [Agrobacterium vitis]MVA52559.1 NAD(P)-binding protein [Agrobacterium vitis]NSZ53794.1 NAD(P)-dependent oxidoreductase [Agrobacterium vitis]NTA32553.1 NAD(P)-dependent oxidoreductase [Agrobacterium vitis]